MVNEIVLGILDPLPLNITSKVETFHPLCSCASSVYVRQLTLVISDSRLAGKATLRQSPS